MEGGYINKKNLFELINWPVTENVVDRIGEISMHTRTGDPSVYSSNAIACILIYGKGEHCGLEIKYRLTVFSVSV